MGKAESQRKQAATVVIKRLEVVIVAGSSGAVVVEEVAYVEAESVFDIRAMDGWLQLHWRQAAVLASDSTCGVQTGG